MLPTNQKLAIVKELEMFENWKFFETFLKKELKMLKSCLKDSTDPIKSSEFQSLTVDFDDELLNLNPLEHE